jgi:hypothetical protein
LVTEIRKAEVFVMGMPSEMLPVPPSILTAVSGSAAGIPKSDRKKRRESSWPTTAEGVHTGTRPVVV